ncbi:MAG TPA: ABC transporter substrate-binding protein, partial [Negativicutes bacterium]|nr:ABC transporter substrate-binding protein [Negativicutes bacterium]
MKKTTIKILSLVLAMVMILSLTACTKPAETTGTEGTASAGTEANSEQKPVVVMTGAAQNTIDIYSSGSVAEIIVIQHVAEPLIEFDGFKDLVPCLATEWSNVEPTAWDFKLREGVKFHDGSPFTAEDVKFNIDRIIERQKNGTLIGNYGYIQASVGFAKVEIIDPKTVRIYTEKPSPVLPQFMSEIHILPKAFLESKSEDELKTSVMGTGPYKFVEWKKDQYIALEKNNDYWGEKAGIEKLIFKNAPEATTRVAELATKGADLIDKVSPDLQSQVKDGAHMEIVASGTRQYLGLVQYGHPIMKLKEVRQAINYSVNVESIIDNLLDGSVKRTGTFINPPWNNPNVTPYPYDPEKAKELLAAAGLKDTNGNGILEYEGKDIKLVIQSPKGRYIKDLEVCQAVAADMKKVGLDVEVRPMDWSVLVGQLDAKKLEGDMFMIGSGSSFEGQGDASDFYSTNSSNYGQWINPEFDKLYDEVAVTFDNDKRKEILYKMQEVMKEDAAMLFMY